MKKVTSFCKALPHPSQWAKENDIPPWLVSRIRKGHAKGITAKYAEKFINAANGDLSLEDFRHD